MKDIKNISVIGLGLLGGSISLAALRSFTAANVTGYSHRPSTRNKARKLSTSTNIVDSLQTCVSCADLVILATPIITFEKIFNEIRRVLKPNGRLITIDCKKELSHFGPPAHLRLSEKELIDMAAKYGFKNTNYTDLTYNYMLQFDVLKP